MSNIEMIQKLLNDKADLQAQINISAFDGSIEIKTVNNEKYIYVRKREAGKYRSKTVRVPKIKWLKSQWTLLKEAISGLSEDYGALVL